MVTLITVLSIGLIGSVMYCVYLTRELADERARRFNAECWIDPVVLEDDT